MKDININIGNGQVLNELNSTQDNIKHPPPNPNNASAEPCTKESRRNIKKKKSDKKNPIFSLVIIVIAVTILAFITSPETFSRVIILIENITKLLSIA